MVYSWENHRMIRTGWWLSPTPSENFNIVSWDYEIPNGWKVIKFMFQTTTLSNASPERLFQTTNQRMFEAFGVDEFDETFYRVFDTTLGK